MLLTLEVLELPADVEAADPDLEDDDEVPLSKDSRDSTPSPTPGT